MAGGKECKEGRQTIVFTPLDPFNSDANEADSITDLKKPRKLKYQIHWRTEQDAVYCFHLSRAQDAGLELGQTSSNAIITYQSVPNEWVVKVVIESGERERIVRKTALTPRERPKKLRQWWEKGWTHPVGRQRNFPYTFSDNTTRWCIPDGKLGYAKKMGVEGRHQNQGELGLECQRQVAVVVGL